MTTPHTPGPWMLCPSTIAGRSSGKIHLEGPNGESIAIVPTHWPEGEANARLIAAAPKMLKALKQGMAIVDHLRLALQQGRDMGLRSEDWQDFEREASALVAEIDG